MNMPKTEVPAPSERVSPFQVIRPGARARFDLQQPYVLRDIVPYAAAVPGTDMGEQLGGAHFLQRSGRWAGDWREATAARYSREVAEKYRREFAEKGMVNVEIVDANAMEARLHVNSAIRREMEDVLSRQALLARFEAIEALPEELFAKAVPGLAATGMLEDPTILAVSGLGLALHQAVAA